MDQNPPSSSHGQQGQRGSAPTYDTSHGGHYGTLASTLVLLLEEVGLE